MGRAKAGANASMLAETPVLQGLQGDVGAETEEAGNGFSGTVIADSVSDKSNPENGSALTQSAMTDGSSLSPSTTLGSGNQADQLAVEPYEVPTWAEFRGYVMENGDKFVRATYPNPPVDLIETIWCGVPVEHHEHARVMTPKREWLVY